MASLNTDKNGPFVVPALRARANFGKLLRRVRMSAENQDHNAARVYWARSTPLIT